MFQYIEYLAYILVIIILYISLNYNFFSKEIRLIILAFAVLHGFSVIILGSYLSLYFGIAIFIIGIYGLNTLLSNEFVINEYDYLVFPDKLVNTFQPLGLIGILATIYYNEFILTNAYGANDYVSFILI